MDNIKDNIIKVIEFGAEVSMSYKPTPDSWFTELQIWKSNHKGIKYIIKPGWTEFDNPSDAVDYYLEILKDKI